MTYPLLRQNLSMLCMRFNMEFILQDLPYLSLDELQGLSNYLSRLKA
jgi:hypothetical protein